ncbi:tetratricopeptide repeat domain-containing protein [Penicillium malachiteum]|uniref:tetratricopeptide repeat domain-containing protein n=1 Tax=Penicillium malachiteum TaxID=1324776 RepID=UPI0025471677|nr:tetratricopeptide repeat domain-containing protein [Penicillium malachiteum]KAJ5715296.1 tetratricopeptide repeat domain-containing protein [Penicillium malachiteum]
MQFRFVIHGLGGSGKTQFCSKFAEMNRERYLDTKHTIVFCLQLLNSVDSFWGVFCIDATSHETIKQTYIEISKRGKVEPNYASAMNWLSNNEGRWLLIIDNANDPRIDLEQYFPGGIVDIFSLPPETQITYSTAMSAPDSLNFRA